MTTKVYVVQIQGWGDDEDHFYDVGLYPTKEKAEQSLREMIDNWVKQGGEEDEVVNKIVTRVVR